MSNSEDDRLFDVLADLEAQAEAVYAVDRMAELSDRSRAEYRQVPLTARLMASVGAELTIRARGLSALLGRLDQVGEDWCLLQVGSQSWMIRTAEVVAVTGLAARAIPQPAWPVTARVGFAGRLRRIADTGTEVVVHCHQTDQSDRFRGRLARVGEDFVEIGADTVVALSAIVAIQIS